MARTRLTGVLALAALALAGCSSGNDTTNPPGGTSLSYAPCTRADYWPVVLLAIQDGTGPWKVLTPSGGTYSTTVQSSKLGMLVATAATSGGGSEVDVVYASAAEAEAYLTGLQCGSSLLTGSITVNNLAAGELAFVGLGWNSSAASGPGNKTFTTQAPANPADLLGVLNTASANATKMIIRRGVNVTAVAPMDFTTAEAFAPLLPSLAITGTGTTPVTFAEWYLSGGIFRNEINYGNASTTLPTTYWGVPAAKQAASDLHELYAYTAETPIGGVAQTRVIDAWWHDPASRTLSFDPLPSAPTITTKASAPYPQLRIQWQQPSGHQYFSIYYYNTIGGDQEATLTATAAYLGGTAVDIAFPDVSTLTGWNNTWMPVAGVPTTWGFTDYRSTGIQSVLGYAPTDGQVTQSNSFRSSLTP